MSIMDMFRMGAKAPEPQQPTTNGQQQQPAAPSVKADPATPDLNAVKQPEGLDKFADLWKAPVKAEDAPADFDPTKIFNFDPAKMAEAVGTINFAEVVGKDKLAAIVAGGEGAMEAFAQALNATAAKTMTLSTTAAGKMIEQAMGQATAAMDQRVAKQVKLNQVNSQMQELNPALSHAAAAPLVNALTTQFTGQFPLATPKEINDKVMEYISNFADLAAGKKDDSEVQANTGTNWMKYLGNEQ